LEAYQAGDLAKAIQIWQAILQGLQPEGSFSSERVTALKYLARAYQQTGHSDPAIAQFNQLLTHYRQVGDLLQVGRILTEQAQLYSALGQHRQAIARLCGTAEESLPGDWKRQFGQEPGQPTKDCASNSALAIARQVGDPLGESAALGSLGNVHRLRGDYDQAIADLEQSFAIAKPLGIPASVISALNGLGNTYASLAKRNYRQLQYAQQSNDFLAIEEFTRAATQADQQALLYFQNSLILARSQQDRSNELKALLNLIVSRHRSLSLLSGPPDLVNASPARLLQQANSLLAQLPDSRDTAYAAMRLASLLQTVTLPPVQANLDPATACIATSTQELVIEWLNRAIAIAQRIQDPQSTAYALGRLGHVYECQNDLPRALTLTQQAQLASGADPSRYLWEWQAGRILKAQGQTKDAIIAYETAVETLHPLRTDLAIASRDFQFDFRDTVEPIYRELTELYLGQVPVDQALFTPPEPSDQVAHKPKQALASNTQDSKLKTHDSVASPNLLLPASPIVSALKTIDDLRLAEVQNYFGDDCSITVFSKPVTFMDEKTAVLSTVILGDRVAVILSLSGKQGLRSQLHWLPSRTQEVTATINQLRVQLEKRSDVANTYQINARKVYDWLIRPFAPTLAKAKIETLVFIQDGILRSVPMAALSDGQEFLVEQYAIASTPSLNLVDPTPLNHRALRVLSFGLTKSSAIEGPIYFEPLRYVQQEIDRIRAILPGSRGLLDEEFTRDRLKQELAQGDFPIVHLATHGRFGIDSRDTFLITGAAATKQPSAGRVTGTMDSIPKIPYNDKLTINSLYRIIREFRRGNSLELLTLTACETAAGSDRDALGIAGISLQAGARSAIASLWQVDDQSTAQLITQFYQNLQQGMSRAKALQLAQKNWLQTQSNSHPGYWAALILLGNWL
jgi:CHAT domain-containing protein